MLMILYCALTLQFYCHLMFQTYHSLYVCCKKTSMKKNELINERNKSAEFCHRYSQLALANAIYISTLKKKFNLYFCLTN